MAFSSSAPLPFLFVDINTLNDFFAENAPMAVGERERLRANLRSLADLVRRHKLIAVAGQDAHAEDDPEFAEHRLPKHALAGSEGAQKISETWARGAPVIPASGQRRPWPKMSELRDRGGELVLEKTTFDLFGNPAFREVLRNLQPEELLVYGAVFEQDIYETALSARNILLPVTVIEDACGKRYLAKADECRGRMLDRGVRYEHTEEVLSRVALWARRQEADKSRRAKESRK